MKANHKIQNSHQTSNKNCDFFAANHPECDLTPLAGLADLLENCDIFPYNEIPNFTMTTVPGHVSRLLFGTLDGITVMLMQGRFHAYEGHPLGLVS